MRMNKFVLVPTALLVLAACAGFPFFGRAEPDLEMTAEADTGQTHVELQNVRYDGRTLTGRLLVGAVGQSVTLDKRIIESIYLTTESVSDCATSHPVGFVAMDVYAQRPREEDLLVLMPG